MRLAALIPGNSRSVLGLCSCLAAFAFAWCHTWKLRQAQGAFEGDIGEMMGIWSCTPVHGSAYWSVASRYGIAFLQVAHSW